MTEPLRRKFTLSDTEQRQFGRLRPMEGEAFRFWEQVAQARGLDPDSILSNCESFTALPLGHNKDWCFPIPLKCVKKAVYKERAS